MGVVQVEAVPQPGDILHRGIAAQGVVILIPGTHIIQSLLPDLRQRGRRRLLRLHNSRLFGRGLARVLRGIHRLSFFGFSRLAS